MFIEMFDKCKFLIKYLSENLKKKRKTYKQKHVINANICQMCFCYIVCIVSRNVLSDVKIVCYVYQKYLFLQFCVYFIYFEKIAQKRKFLQTSVLFHVFA